MKKTKKIDPGEYLTSQDAADFFSVSRATILFAIKSGYLPATKVKGRYLINAKESRGNKKQMPERIRKLKAEYVSLYWQGLNPEQLQNRVKADFIKNKIICNAAGFAEKAIYDSLVKKASHEI